MTSNPFFERPILNSPYSYPSRHWELDKDGQPGVRPFCCQIEAAETAIWLTEVAPHLGKDVETVLRYLVNANNNANPQLMPPDEAEDGDLKGEERKEAEKNNERARLWISTQATSTAPGSRARR